VNLDGGVEGEPAAVASWNDTKKLRTLVELDVAMQKEKEEEDEPHHLMAEASDQRL